MPRYSERKAVLRELERMSEQRMVNAEWRFVFDNGDDDEDEMDEWVNAQLEEVRANRYLVRASSYRKRPSRWETLLNDSDEINDTEILEHFRVTRPLFRRIVELIKDDEVFKAAPHKTFRGPVELHLMVLLKYLGSYGNENTPSKLGQFFGFAKGSTNNYVSRAVRALLKLHDASITWPDADERQVISAWIEDKYGFPNCVGMTDGTVLPLETKPRRNGEDYFCRKGFYAVHALITCDDLARIRHVVVGWPGSVHDNRVWSETDLAEDPQSFFAENEHLLGDAAFQASSIMIPPFKKPAKARLERHKKYFNTRLAKPRTKSEHSIGLIKSRFQYFRCILARLDSEADMRRIIELFLCACILQNILVHEPTPVHWDEKTPNQSRVLESDDELNAQVPGDAGNCKRRDQLLNFILEQSG